MSDEDSQAILDVVDGYRIYVINKNNAHAMSAIEFDNYYRMLGIPTTIISAVVGSSIFASLASNDKNLPLMIITGSLSIGAAILAALQTFLRYAELAQAHKTAAGGYEAIRRNIDTFILKTRDSQTDRAKIIQYLEEIVKELNALGNSSPNISERIYNKSVDKSKKRAMDLRDMRKHLKGFAARV